MEPTEIVEAVAALREKRFDDYRSIVRGYVYGEHSDQLWQGIAAAHPAEIDLVETVSTLQSSQAASIGLHLFPALSKLPLLSQADVIRLLESSVRVPLSHLHLVGAGIQAQMALSPNLGNSIGDYLSQGVTDPIVARTWAITYCEATPVEAAKYAVAHFGGAAAEKQLVVSLLTFLPVSSSKVSEIVAPKEKELSDLLLAETANMGLPAWEALSSYAKRSTIALGYLVKAIDEEVEGAITAFSSELYKFSNPDLGTQSLDLKPLVKKLLAAGYHNQNVTANVDSGIQLLLHRNEHKEILARCLAELGDAEKNITEVFGGVFGLLENYSVEFIHVLTAWLLLPNANFGAIHSLLSRCVATRAPTGIDRALFVAADNDRQIKAMRRLLALTNNGPVLCTFIAQIAEMSELKGTELDFTSQMLNSVFEEYPEATEQFLREKSRSSSRALPVTEIYRGVLANVLRWRRVLSRLPKLNELRPTDEERRAIRSLRVRLNRDVNRQATEKSIFLKASKTSHVAQGLRFATHNFKTPPVITAMTKSSFSIELPSSELSDPLKGSLQRAKLLQGAL